MQQISLRFQNTGISESRLILVNKTLNESFSSGESTCIMQVPRDQFQWGMFYHSSCQSILRLLHTATAYVIYKNTL